MKAPIKRAAGVTAALAAAVLCAATTQTRSTGRAFHHDSVVDLALELDAASIRSLTTNPGKDVPGKLSVGNSARYKTPLDVEVHLKGQMGSKRSFDSKPAMKIDVAKGADVFGLEHLTLNNMVQDPTMVHEALGYQEYADAGVMVPETAYVRLTIDGQPYGLYLLVETIDRQFLKRRFGNDRGILYEGSYGTDLRAGDEPKFELDEGQDPGRKQLVRLIGAVTKGGDGLFYGPGALVDTPTFLSMMAVGVLIADWDNYYHANNYRIYWNPAAERWFFIPTGIDQTFTKESASVFGGHGVLFRKCLESKRCAADYVATVRKTADRFERSDLPARMDRLAAMLEAVLREDKRKPYSTATIDKAREKMRRFIEARPDVIRSSLPSASAEP